MGLIEFILKVYEGISFPVVVLLFLILFKSQLKSILDRITKATSVKYKEIEINLAIKDIDEKLSPIFLKIPVGADFGFDLLPKGKKSFLNSESFIETDPVRSISVSFGIIEDFATGLAYIFLEQYLKKDDITYGLAIDFLYGINIFNNNIYEGLKAFGEITKELADSEVRKQISVENAKSFLNLAKQTVAILASINPQGGPEQKYYSDSMTDAEFYTKAQYLPKTIFEYRKKIMSKDFDMNDLEIVFKSTDNYFERNMIISLLATKLNKNEQS